MRKINILSLMLVLVVVLFSSCNKDDDDDVVQNYLVDSEELASSLTNSSVAIKVLLSTSSELEGIANNVKYDVTLYKITYKTAFEDDSIYVSGVIAVPVVGENSNKEFPMLSYQHGTIVLNSDAPSENYDISYDVNNDINYDNITEASVILRLASLGMVIVVPDYIGFGDSEAEFHPYMINKYSTNAVLDMIRAAKEFIAIEKPCSINDQLFMFGYSQGGTATLAALSAIQNDNANSDLSVSLVSCGSGAYDMTGFREWVMDQAYYGEPAFVAYILKAYKEYYDETIDYSSIFESNFSSQIDGMFDGVKDISDINNVFGTENIEELFNDDFENTQIYDTAAVYESLRDAFAENTLSAWNIPSGTSVVLLYGDDDLTVPVEQTIKMWEEFNLSNVTWKSFSSDDLGYSANHVNTFLPSVQYTFQWFLENVE